MKRITILGAGNGGVTAAYHFKRMGHAVCLYDQPSFDTQIKAIQEAGGIKALDRADDVTLMYGGFQVIDLVTTDMQEAVAFSDLLVMIVPAFAQEPMFQRMLPYLTDDHTLVTMPGNYASLVLNRLKEAMGYHTLDLTYVDTTTIPWACRLFEPANVGIMGIKTFIYAGVFPRSRTQEALDKVNACFPLEVKALGNVLEAGLENINFGGHPLITTINIGLLENFHGQFNYYSDCVSPSTDRASEKMEQERLSIGEALGLSLKPELDMMNALYGTEAKSVFEFNKGSVTHGKIHSAPDSAKNRYITEDVPHILVPCYELARLSALDVPIIESCIHIASAYNDDDYFKSGRTLSSMGLAHMTKGQILDYVNR